ncbi:type I secretion system permease/ATPase [Thioclava sp. JE_KL1]|uniref:type I secretion system permease/ATPase n=1 Tax=Thioclava sp. JE_KL1 TaxID=2651187 RepID=UPI00128AF8C7|nr:type I secretion system permease/ATPase [Thioclava sp. JE_KL1]MPQ95991.1 type I secretion system permease/ATPase [Thioclava sp. JE_KL1]
MTKAQSQDPLVLGLVELCRLNGIQAHAKRLTDGLIKLGQGLKAADAAVALRRVNMSCRIARVALDEIPLSSLPVLLFLEGGQTLVLEELEADQAIVIAPESGGGRLEIARAELENRYAGTALFSRPVDVLSDRLGEKVQDKHHWILGPVLGNAILYRDVILAALVANLLAVGTSLFSMQVYDRVVPSGAFDTLWILASGVGLAICLEWALRVMRAKLIDVSGRDLDLQLSAKLFEQVTNLRLSHQPKSTGVFANQVREFATVREFFTSGTVAAVSDLPFVFIFIAIIAFIGGPVALVTVFGAVAIVLPGIALQKRLAKASRENAREASALNGLLLETVSNLETVKAARAETRLQRAYGQLSETIAASSIRNRELTTLISQFVSSVQQFAYAGVVIVGVYRVSGGAMTVGALIACTLLSGRALRPMGQVAGLLARWQNVRAALEGLDAIMEMPTERPVERSFVRASEISGGFGLADLQFRHDPEAQPVLNMGKMTVEPGEHIALLGGNGAGKSTLLRVLAGYLEPQSGSLLLDNLALSQIDPIDRRRQIGYLPQSVALFQGTLRDNLLLDHGLHSDEDLLSALDAVGLGVFVRRHVRGLDLQIHGNSNVSGGQRQAIGLARVLLQDPRVVLLDEPTASFDQNTERHVIEHLQAWLKGRTTIIATHRKELLSLVDRAVILKDGRIAHDGTLGQIYEIAARGQANQVKAVK